MPFEVVEKRGTYFVSNTASNQILEKTRSKEAAIQKAKDLTLEEKTWRNKIF